VTDKRCRWPLADVAEQRQKDSPFTCCSSERKYNDNQGQGEGKGQKEKGGNTSSLQQKILKKVGTDLKKEATVPQDTSHRGSWGWL
jgi:hypothetical protein